MNNLDDQLRYPIGKFTPKESYTTDELHAFIRRIADLPIQLENQIKNFDFKDFDIAYREGGWTGRQVIHHMADSHMNAYIRFKWTITEDSPVIKAYDEKAWAETEDIAIDPLISLNVLKALHIKWALLLKSITPHQLQKYFIHPETRKEVTLGRMIALYAWHGDHHLGHLKIIADKR